MKIRIITTGALKHAYRWTGAEWLPMTLTEARRLIALGRAVEVSHA